MKLADQIDALSLETLQSRGGIKWSQPDATYGAFIAETDFGTAPDVSQVIADAVTNQRFGYLSPIWVNDLKLATSNWVTSYHEWAVSPEDVWVTADVLAVLRYTILTHTQPGDEIIVPTPCYMPFLTVPTSLDRSVRQVPLVWQDDKFTFDFDQIDAAFADGAKLFILCNPQNPLGLVHTRDELEQLAQIVNRHGGRVFADEIWAPLIFRGKHISYASLPDAAEHTLTAISTAKAWNLPGLKCAQAITSNDADRERMEVDGLTLQSSAASVGVLAATQAYRNESSWLADIVAYLDRNRETIENLLPDLLPTVKMAPVAGTYSAWLDWRETGLSEPGAFMRQHASVAMTEGTSCGAIGAGFARFIFALPRPLLITAFERMAEALASAKQ